MFDTVNAIAIVGVLVASMIAAVDSSIGSIRAEQTKITLQTARDALIMYATANDGCLPFAADYEGGLPNTDQTGAPGYTDTGVAKDDIRAGDLPWAELGLAETFRDGDDGRIQYYVASQYADLSNGCVARQIGEEWNPIESYDGSDDPIYLHFTPPGGSHGLYVIDGPLASGTRPDSASYTDISDALPASLLELRRGPNIKKNGPQKDVLSAQNVFVLIATGDNINGFSSNNLPYMRDENHRAGANGQPWNLNLNNVDDVRFAATHEFDANDQGKDGDDMLMVVSFLSFKSELGTFGVHVEPFCKTAC